MSVSKDRRPSHTPGSQFKVQTFTLTGTGALNATRVKKNGLTIIDSTGTGTHTLRLEAPNRAGIMKTIVARLASTADVRVQTHSTATLIGGTTNNHVTFDSSTTENTLNRSVTLVSKSTAAWSLVSRTTAVNLGASTLIV